MTHEREAMTLERQAFEEWVKSRGGSVMKRTHGSNDTGDLSIYYVESTTRLWEDAWQAAITNLSRAAEPVCPMYQYLTIFGWEGCYWLDCSKDDYDKQPTHLRRILYTRPPEPARDAKCMWVEDEDGNWETGCGNLHIVIDGTPFENDMRFCCYCGHAIDQVLHHHAAMAQGSGDAT